MSIPGQEKQFIQALLDWYDEGDKGPPYKYWCPKKKVWAEKVSGRCGYEGCKACGADSDFSWPHGEDAVEEELLRRLREFVGQKP